MRDLQINDNITIPAQSLRATTSRSGGPGGQNVNKLETKVTIEVDVDSLPLSEEKRQRIREKLAGRITRQGVLRVTSQAERTQLANRDRALARMEQLLRGALQEERPRKKSRVPKAQKQQRLENKRRRAETKRLRTKFD